ncbi:MAG: single-stranded DNA-binding protein [Candidatus Margulisiibacteriota bacterium]
MASLNRIILIGRLTDSPEARVTVDGVPVAKFRLAVNRPATEGMNTGTDFIDIVAWQKVAESCGKLLSKGQMALVDGRIQNRTYEDQSGQRKWVVEVVARNVLPLEKAHVKDGGAMFSSEEVVDDSELAGDLPF